MEKTHITINESKPNPCVDLAIRILGSQQKLSKKSGISQGTISAYNTGIKRPSKESAESLSRAVNFAIPWYNFMTETTRPRFVKKQIKQTDNGINPAL